ncbi:MAG: RNA methyltransferase [Anaerolineaceae bacterium]|nr:RNA methyltransferase [Anaerolineaceae bacterium]
MAEITSTHNPKIQHVRALLNQKSARDEEKLFVVEGVRLAEEALAAGQLPVELLYSSELSPRGLDIVDTYQKLGADPVEVTPQVLTNLSATETTQGILLVLSQSLLPLPPLADFIVVLDQIRDPGNMGTILRSAAAAGAQAVFTPPGNTDPFSPKVVRSGMGAHFRLSLQDKTWPQIVDYCKNTQKPPLQLWLAESGGGKSCWQADLRTPLALVIGGEADGASEEARKAVDDLLNIPMPGKFESLNAAVAAGILLFEIVRQRNQP